MAVPKLQEQLTALIQTLRADSTLLTLLGPADGLPLEAAVYNHVPQDNGFPLCHCRMGSGRQWDTKTSKGWAQSVILTIWTDQHGDLNALEIAQAIDDLLHNNLISLPNGQTVLLRHESYDTTTAGNGVAHRADLRFQWITSS